ncbi:hypothetical protein LPJ56_002935 [Coemansia sp. RSA 2599]|nr:hypothetical protein LPJ75_002651 [Coemansia sp. RSA 2598]KAJ1823711.1 hypothetical protein LPJ56_002935 [Coemansia sp. RSA 2599]
MYVFREVGWDVENKSWLLDGKLPLYGGKSWGIYLAWISLCIVASLSILIHVYFIGSRRAVGDKHLSANTLSQSVSSIGSSGVWDGVAGNRGSVDQGTAGLRRMALRNAGFAFVPLVTGLSSVVCAMAPHRVGWLYGLALVMAATQGVLCLAMLAVNVEMDRLLRVLVGGRPGKTAEPKPSEVELHLDFARLDNTSTIHLSPYQSRGSSIS